VSERRYRLLVMSIGSLVGAALLECLEAMGRRRFDIVAMNSVADAVNNFRADTCYLSPVAASRDALHALLDALVDRHAPDLVVPTRDDDVVVLAEWAAKRPRERRGVSVMAGSTLMAEVMRDKWESYAWATRNGLPFARSAIDDEGVRALVRDVGYPLIAKPRKGFASHGVRMLLDASHAQAALAAGDMIVQAPIDPSPMLTHEALRAGMPLWFAPVQPGSPLTLCLLDEAGVTYIAAWESKHLRGAAFDTRLLQDNALQRLARDYADVAWRDGWRGLFNLQVRRAVDGAWLPIELAGRFMGGTNALEALGVPVVGIVLQRFIAGFDVPFCPSPRYDARAIKQARTHLLRDADVSALRDRGVWSAPR
jgi:hypothetical protein